MKDETHVNRRKNYAKAIERAIQISNPHEIIEPEVELPPVSASTPGGEPLFPSTKRVWKRADGVQECRMQVYLPAEEGRNMQVVCAKLGISHSAFMRRAVTELLKRINIP